MPEQTDFSLTLESQNEAVASLHVRRVSASEAISRPYSVVVDAFAIGSTPPASDLAGQALTLVASLNGEVIRRFAGLCVSAEEDFQFEDPDRGIYRLVIAPRVHFFTLVKAQSISLETSIPEIIQQKLKLVGLEHPTASRLSLLGDYKKRDIVVQWDETDLAFVGRLTEHLGISYFFEQTDEGERIVFTDHNGGFPLTSRIDGKVSIASHAHERAIRTLRVANTCVPAAYLVMDYNYRTPNVDLTGSAECKDGFAGGVVEFGGHFKTQPEGAALARVRADQAQSERVVYEGTSSYWELTAGHRIVVDGHPRVDGLELLVIEVEHQSDIAGDTEAFTYANRFRAVPVTDKSTYRPPRRTPKPKISGLLTGVVQPREQGVVERYAQIDEHGRYTIRFLYDPTPGERKASHPVRKAEPTVGPDYGMHFPLRPGVEVIMGFVNGDPDRPIILGGLHNTTVPAHVRDANSRINGLKTASGIKMHFKDD